MFGEFVGVLSHPNPRRRGEAAIPPDIDGEGPPVFPRQLWRRGVSRSAPSFPCRHTPRTHRTVCAPCPTPRRSARASRPRRPGALVGGARTIARRHVRAPDQPRGRAVVPILAPSVDLRHRHVVRRSRRAHTELEGGDHVPGVAVELDVEPSAVLVRDTSADEIGHVARRDRRIPRPVPRRQPGAEEDAQRAGGGACLRPPPPQGRWGGVAVVRLPQALQAGALRQRSARRPVPRRRRTLVRRGPTEIAASRAVARSRRAAARPRRGGGRRSRPGGPGATSG